MQRIQTQEVLFSFDDPQKILNDLQVIFQEIRSNVIGRATIPTPLHARSILLLDADRTRANAIAHVLSSVGFTPFIAGNALEAFTLFLRGTFVPYVILLGQDDANNRFFLSRLLQQVSQKYQWDTPIIPIRTERNLEIAPDTEDLLPKGKALLDIASLSQGISSSLSTQTTAPVPRRVDTTRELPSSLSTQTTAPMPRRVDEARELPSEVERVKQMSFPQEQQRMLPAIRVTPPEPVINISTHELPFQQRNAPKISLEGTSIGRYHMKAFLGSGALGQVYQTYDRLREQDVALKAVQVNALPSEISEEIDSDANFFQQEIELVRKLDSPHILLPLNSGKSYISGSPFVYKTMPYLPDGSIATKLYQMGTTKLLAPQEVILIVSQIAETLQHLHSFQITYQNFKLSNFLIQMQGKKKNFMHIFLTDFVIVHNQTILVKEPHVFPYMAPECWHGQSLLASDQYGLAAVTYELLTGRVLFQGKSEHIMRQLHMNMQPQPLTIFAPHLHPRVNTVVLRALAKRAEDRFPSVMDFAAALRQSLE